MRLALILINLLLLTALACGTKKVPPPIEEPTHEWMCDTIDREGRATQLLYPFTIDSMVAVKIFNQYIKSDIDHFVFHSNDSTVVICYYKRILKQQG